MIEILERKLAAVPSPEEQEENRESEETLDPRVLSSVLVSVKLSQIQEEPSSSADPHARLLELMHSQPIRALLDAAVTYSKREAIPAHEGLQQLVLSLQTIDKLWNQVLMKEGLARLSSQYH